MSDVLSTRDKTVFFQKYYIFHLFKNFFIQHDNKIRWWRGYVSLVSSYLFVLSHDKHSFGIILKCRHTSFSRFFNILTWWSELCEKKKTYRLFPTWLVTKANTHPIEGNCRYKRYSWHERVRQLAVIGQEFLSLFVVRALLDGVQVHGYALGALVHYPYRVYVIFDHATDKLQSYRWILDNVDGTCVYDICLTLDRSVLTRELISVVCLRRLYKIK